MKHEYSLRQKRELAINRGIERGMRMLRQGEQRSIMFSRVRMGIFLLTLLVCGVIYSNKWFVMGNWVLAAWITIFTFVAHYHTRLEDELTRLRLWLNVKQTNLARLQLDWENIPDSHNILPKDHPYALDLDVIGGYSLLRLLDTTVSNEGQIRLISWVAGQNEQPLSLAQWLSRQKLVNAFKRFSGLRDRIRLVAKLVSHTPINCDAIHVLLKSSFDIPRLHLQLVLAVILANVNVVFFVVWAMGMAQGYWICLLYTSPSPRDRG